MSSFDYNDLFEAFEAGWREAYQMLTLDPGSIHLAFEDWLHNKEHA